MKNITYIIFLLLIVLLPGCAKHDKTPTGISNGEYNLALNITRAVGSDPYATASEIKIVSARMIVVATGNTPQQGRVTCNQYFTEAELAKSSNVAQAWARSGLSDVYLIVNEPSVSTAKLAAADDLKKLQDATINFSTAPVVGATAIPMMQCYRNVTIGTYPTVTTVDVTKTGVDRMWTKIRVRFKSVNDATSIAAGYPDMSGMTIKKVQLLGVPNYSYLIARTYPYSTTIVEDGLHDDAEVVKDHVLSSGAFTDLTSSYEFYAPEFLGATSNHHSFLKVTATTTIDNSMREYTMPLGEEVANGNYDLSRNSYYDIAATIRGYGKGDVDVVTNVKPWNKVSSEPVVGDYDFSLNKTMVEIYENEVDASLELINFSNPLLQQMDVKIVSTTGKTYTKMSYDKATAKVTLQAGELSNGSFFDELQVTIGSVTKTVTVRQMQFIMLFAEGDLKVNPSGGLHAKPIIAPANHKYPIEEQLVFRWGSLIGINAHTSPQNDTDQITTANGLKYTPTEYPHTSLNWRETQYPYVTFSNPVYDGDNTKNHLPADSPINGTGDICRFALGENWHTPTVGEFRRLIAYGKKRIGNPAITATFNNSGVIYGNDVTTATPDIVNVLKNGLLFIPFNLMRDDGGKSGEELADPHYWSSSYGGLWQTMPPLGSYGILRFHSVGLPTGEVTHTPYGGNNGGNRGYGFSVRCIRNYTGDGRPVEPYTYPTK